jgi:hypothetical protein
MAAQQKAPIYVTRGVWDEVEDMSEVLVKMTKESEGGERESEEKGEG